MPILPPVVAQPYDLANTIVQAAQVRLNDEIKTLDAVSGKILANTNAFSQQTFNSAYRRMMGFLANLGYTRLNREAVITGLPAVASNDPASQCYINWTNFFDGVSFTDTQVLPSDLIFPLKLWERITGQNARFQPMEYWLDGLPTNPKTWRNCIWEWREDSIYFPGAQQSFDLRIKYSIYLPDLIDISDVRWYEQAVPIVQCLDSLAWYICAELANGRGGEMTDIRDEFTRRGEAAAKLIYNREVRTKQRVNVRRQPRSGRYSAGNSDGSWNGGGFGGWY